MVAEALSRQSRRLRLLVWRRAVRLAALSAALVVLVAAAAWFATEERALRAGAPAENAAVVDAGATNAVVEQVSSAVQAVFSANYANLDRTRRAAERVLVGSARQLIDGKLAELTRQAADRELIRTASVRSVGVTSLRGDTAEVLVFLDQQTLTTGSNEQTSSVAYLTIMAERVGDDWKIAEISGS